MKLLDEIISGLYTFSQSIEHVRCRRVLRSVISVFGGQDIIIIDGAEDYISWEPKKFSFGKAFFLKETFMTQRDTHEHENVFSEQMFIEIESSTFYTHAFNG